MEVLDGHSAVSRMRSKLAAPAAVALGNFDGVHVGHRELLRRAHAAASSLAGSAMAMTFEPHPAVVLAPNYAPKMISSVARRLELIAEEKIDVCVLEPFTRELASLSPEAFFGDILCEALGAKHVVVGYDFTFGRQRSGNTDTLRELGKGADVAIEIVEAVAAEDIVASSTKVRNFLGEGNLAGARLLLGRNYDSDGTIVEGAKRGRELGYPTANVATDIDVIAPTGIYAAWVDILSGPFTGERRMAATSLGTNPTFGEQARTLEPHLLDFEGDLYGARVRVEFVEYLRPEQRFSSIGELTEAIDRDIEATRRHLSRHLASTLTSTLTSTVATTLTTPTK